MIGTLSFLLFWAAMGWVALHGPANFGGLDFATAYAMAFAGMLGLWKRIPEGRWSLPALLLMAAAARLMLLPYPANPDLFRYLWEGHIQNLGFNPFVTPPAAPELAPYRTDYWSLIEHKRIPAIYFPFLQWVFRAAAAIQESPYVFKLVFIGFELGAIGFLAGTARKLGVETRHLVLYALNPLAILYTAGEGHAESVLVFWLAGAIYFHSAGNPRANFLALGFAVMTNLKAAFLPWLFLRRGNLKHFPFVLLPVLLAIPFVDSGASLFDAPLRFGMNFHFNGPLYNLLHLTGLDAALVSTLCGALFLLAFAMVFILVPDPLRAAYLASSAFLLCLPTLHPWYFLMAAPWLILYRAPAWLLLHLTAAAVFPVYARFWQTGRWMESPALFILEFLPPALLLILSMRSPWRSRKTGGFPPPQTVSIIIPALNEEKNILACMRDLKEKEVTEILVVDGGSADGTCALAEAEPGVRVLHSPPGRGLQIATGAKAATGDVILVLHADSRLEPGAIGRLLEALRLRPDAPGGAFGGSYTDARLKFRVINALNIFRARFFGISFGDQAQFYRRAALPEGFPALRLMEDVELSMRLKEVGPVLLLVDGVVNSTRRWKTRGYFGNGWMVIRLTAGYLIRRRLGLEKGVAETYYRRYYR